MIEPAEFARLGLPRPEDNDQMSALFLTAKEGYAFTADPNEPRQRRRARPAAWARTDTSRRIRTCARFSSRRAVGSSEA